MTISSSHAAGSAADLLAAAAGGDEDAFRALVGPRRRELLAHCYRMLGSLDDAEDAVQETMLKAWRALPGFQGRSSLRAWLYRIATNVCLDLLEHRARRVLPQAVTGPADPALPPDADDPDMPWLQPYPDILLEISDPNPLADPAAAVMRREHIELAFITAVHYLPPRQRAVLLLRDVLGWPAAATAQMLDMTAASVNSAMQRARATLSTRQASRLPSPSPGEAEVAAKYLMAWQAADVAALVALLQADATMSMPPTPSWYQGRDNIGIYLTHLFASPWGQRLSAVPTAANRQPALAIYTSHGEPFAVKVLTVHNGLITAITGFVSPHLFAWFGLPERFQSSWCDE